MEGLEQLDHQKEPGFRLAARLPALELVGPCGGAGRRLGRMNRRVRGHINTVSNVNHAVAARRASARRRLRRLRRITRRLCRRPTSVAATHAEVQTPATHARWHAIHPLRPTIPSEAPPLAPWTTLSSLATPPPPPPPRRRLHTLPRLRPRLLHGYLRRRPSSHRSPAGPPPRAPAA